MEKKWIVRRLTFMSKKKNKLKKNKENNWDIFKLLTIVLAIWMVFLTYQVNSLGKGQLADDIIISSPQIDYKPLGVGQGINISLDITNNYDGAILSTLELDEIRLNGKRENSFTKHSWISLQEQKINGDDETSFISTFEAEKKGEYELIFIIFYNYPQDQDPTKGKSRFYTLPITYE